MEEDVIKQNNIMNNIEELNLHLSGYSEDSYMLKLKF